MSALRFTSKTFSQMKETPLVSHPLKGAGCEELFEFQISHCPECSQFCPFHHLPLRDLSCALTVREMSAGQEGFSLL